MSGELTNERAGELLQDPKWVVRNGGTRVPEQAIPVAGGFPRRDWRLISESGEQFVVSLKSSDKRALKLSMHHGTAKARHVGLLRVDYSGKHSNPDVDLRDVPEMFHPFAGEIFGYDSPHIHLYVAGYDMRWAIPLALHEFPVKTIESDSDIPKAIRAFGAAVSLQTPLIPEDSK